MCFRWGGRFDGQTNEISVADAVVDGAAEASVIKLTAVMRPPVRLFRATSVQTALTWSTVAMDAALDGMENYRLLLRF